MSIKQRANKAREDSLSFLEETQSQTEATPDQLQAIRREIERYRDLELEKVHLEDRLREVNESIKKIREQTLVDLMDGAQVRNLGVDASGNKPAFEVEIKPYCHANIGADWEPERRAAAFSWITDNKHGDMIKGVFTIQLGRGTSKLQTQLRAALKKMKIDYTYDRTVPWNTLTAFVKEQVEVYHMTPPLDLLGATVGRVAQIKKQKKEK